MTRVELAHAKVNLSLRVLAREASGYHQIETLFCALELADEIEVAAAPEMSLTLGGEWGPGAGIPVNQENLAWRAASLFAERTGTGDAHIMLTKRIPHGAGLGGGSSDAAAVLRALNSLHGDIMTADELLSAGAAIGSDVPFFITGAALALAWGRGDRLLPLPPLPSAPILLVMPDAHIATAEAYEALSRMRADGFRTKASVLTLPESNWSNVARSAVNDFETHAMERIPLLGELLHEHIESGALLARMTGTGSVVFGVYRDVAAAESARARFAQRSDVRVWLTRTLGHVESEID
jgi:4-diphosphocytidyl-2-C-methyl-D-erythritol kinase